MYLTPNLRPFRGCDSWSTTGFNKSDRHSLISIKIRCQNTRTIRSPTISSRQIVARTRAKKRLRSPIPWMVVLERVNLNTITFPVLKYCIFWILLVITNHVYAADEQASFYDLVSEFLNWHVYGEVGRGESESFLLVCRYLTKALGTLRLLLAS